MKNWRDASPPNTVGKRQNILKQLIRELEGSQGESYLLAAPGVKEAG